VSQGLEGVGPKGKPKEIVKNFFPKNQNQKEEKKGICGGIKRFVSQGNLLPEKRIRKCEGKLDQSFRKGEGSFVRVI